MDQRGNEKNNREFGNVGEEMASTFLKNEGYLIICKNYRVGRMGEIDIIAKDKEYICFIEVKTRKSDKYGKPCEAITNSKKAIIRKIASIYLKNTGMFFENVRFDVVEIMLYKDEDKINLIKNAF